MTTPWTLTFDAAEPGRLAAFWKVALGYVDAPPPQGFTSWEDWLVRLGVPEDEWDDGASIADPEGVRPTIGFLKVPEGKTAKNRLHLDVQAGGGRGGPWEVRWARVIEAVDAAHRRGRRRHRTVRQRRRPRPHGDGRPRGQRVLRGLSLSGDGRVNGPRRGGRTGRK